ncbi:response regulator [Allosphingosinicella vermicomposti]|uniref:response regulator n=1 Tax=Allosphingosinicella vermicomposti TaxID=614671 RepID=UPI000D0F83F2|nr:response regulator [Allosphingosinicella vermicomposti]
MKPLDPVKLLMVDDVDKNLDALQALLAQEGVNLLRARSGAEALELLLVHDVALALLDVQMPGMDGFELAELMRGTERTRRVPIIFLTAVATDERRRFRGYEAGAVDYLLKPVDPQVVRNKVDIFVELARQRQEIASQRDDLASALARIQAHGDNSPLAVVEFGPDLRIISWSKGAERLFGWPAADVLGLPAAELPWLPQDEIHALERCIREIGEAAERRRVETFRARHQDGSPIASEWYCSALLSPVGTLVSVNAQILDVTERQKAEETQRLLIGELNHRVKNTLASVQAIAAQTLKHSAGPDDFAPTFMGRIHALAAAHSLLSATTWKGARLRELVDGQVQLGTIDPSRLHIGGPAVDLDPEPALHLALVLHELFTNAIKYGALSNDQGNVRLNWTLADNKLDMDWVETGGPAVAAPSRRGFGTSLIERSLKAEGGIAQASYDPDGLHWRLTLPYEGNIALDAGEDRIAPQITSAPVRAGIVQGKRFLVIEDEPLVALDLLSLLHDAGVEAVGPAATAEDALRIIGKTALDGALLDGNLQGQAVDEVAAALTQRNVPFLFVSGYGPEHLPRDFADVPILTKPFNPELLLESMANLVDAVAIDAAA